MRPAPAFFISTVTFVALTTLLASANACSPEASKAQSTYPTAENSIASKATSDSIDSIDFEARHGIRRTFPMIDNNYNWVNEMPQFPDGEAALLKYISDHLVYPEEAPKDSIQGRVTVAALVTETGEIGEVVVTRSKSYKLEKAAVDVVKSLPKFKPVHRDGQPVAVWITLPVNFRLPQISRFVAK